jgi:hypothetical protein
LNSAEGKCMDVGCGVGGNEMDSSLSRGSSGSSGGSGTSNSSPGGEAV